MPKGKLKIYGEKDYFQLMDLLDNIVKIRDKEEPLFWHDKNFRIFICNKQFALKNMVHFVGYSNMEPAETEKKPT